ncbi:MarR family winged helix-turn-helix transcriptional regulator [Paenibacillus alkalitolerans]|uniref:MarR family winged helix-turn-helix transcriptional regulator n=1 Tax=Paenibacillus alkalitolerans TaxID=2799335 RepID=UPI0018F2E30C|nr:MarR family transcriptional regulator [Paenibacillus alkalitolerans]
MKAELEQFLAYFQAINRHLRSAAFDQNQQPITRVQWLLMRQLHRRGGMTIGQLAEHLDVRPSTMSQMLDRLEKSGYVARKPDAQDARVKVINLTETGSEMIRKTEVTWMEALSEPFGHLGEDEREMFVRLMKKLSDHLPKKGDA